MKRLPPVIWRQQSGFSLVELAIALTVIGLLLAGVIKGRELMDNARASRLIAEVKQYDSAAIAFKDVYGQLPGDLTNPARVPDCTGAPCTDIEGNGNGIVGLVYTNVSMASDFNVAYLSATSENRGFWIQLAKAGMITSINKNYNGTPSVLGLDYPETPFTGVGFDVYYWLERDPYDFISGHYIKTKTAPLDGIVRPLLSSAIVAQIDRKIDDGKPLSGRVIGWNSMAGATGLCDLSGRYAQSSTARCEASIRLGF